MNKAAVFSIFVQFLAFVTNHFAAHVKILQSDGGEQYISCQFQQFLRKKGWFIKKFMLLYPKAKWPSWRKDRHIVEAAITLLQKAYLPSKFWIHDCAAATYLIYRIPTSVTSVLHMQLPFELIYHSPPRIDHLRLSACVCYPSMKPYRCNKLK